MSLPGQRPRAQSPAWQQFYYCGGLLVAGLFFHGLGYQAVGVLFDLTAVLMLPFAVASLFKGKGKSSR